MAEYVRITEEDFKSIFKTLGVEASIQDIPRCQELVWNITTPNPKVLVRIYSSIDYRTRKSRDCGEDAIRLVFWSAKGNHPIGKGKRIYRVTSVESVGRRIAERIQEFLANAKQINPTDWDYVRAVLTNSPKNDFTESLLGKLNQFKSLTENQSAYVLGKENPKGFDTMEERLRKHGWEYSTEFTADDASNPGQQAGPAQKAQPGPKKPDKMDIKAEAQATGPQPARPTLTDTPGMDLSTTADYPCYKFTHFNPVQTLTLPFKNQDINLVIGANTSAGKTVCAELLMEETLKAGRRIIYLSPLKSLTQEKYDDWQVRFAGCNISILTGDYTLSEKRKEELQKAHIIVMTSEMADSRTRRMEAERNYWLHEVGLVIVDETHILTTERGHPVESGIMRFTSINRNARILFLSATMPNVEELGHWLSSLNGKQTQIIFSRWRPVELQYHYVEYPIPLSRGGGTSNYFAAQEFKKRLAIDIIKSKPDEKFLVFCHDKTTGHSLVKRLRDEGIDSLFHNADLDLEERLETERSFANRQGGLRVLVSTSTLAWGRNLPARNVVIVGIHRGLQEVDELDIIQMAGRAGRYGIDPEGHVYLIIPQGSTFSWQQTFANPRPVSSVLTNHSVLAFHVLAEIQNRVVRDARTLLKWYSRSLAFFQNKVFSLEDAEALLTDLEHMEMVVRQSGYYTLTGLGKVCGWLYYSPYDVAAWCQNFRRLFSPAIDDTGIPVENGSIAHSNLTVPVDDLTIAWAIADIPSNNWGYIPRDVADECSDIHWQLRNRGIMATDSIHFVLAALKALTGTDIENGTLKADVRAIRYDIRRMVQAFGLIDTMYAKWNQKAFWKVLPARVIYGVPAEMAELTRLGGIGGVKARKMWELGIHSLQDVVNNPEILKRMFVPTMAFKVRKEAKLILEEEKGGKENE